MSKQQAVITLRGDALKALRPNATNRLLYRRMSGLVTRTRNQWKERMVEAWFEAGRPQLKGRCRLEIKVRRGRSLDNDGVVAGCKALIDAVCWTRYADHGLLPNDNDEWLAAPTVVQETGGKWTKQPELVFTFTLESERLIVI